MSHSGDNGVRERQAWERFLKTRGSCEDCGLGPAQGRRLTFDHRDRADAPRKGNGRVRPISVYTHSSWGAFREQLAKCDLVCRPCHDVRERSRDQASVAEQQTRRV